MTMEQRSPQFFAKRQQLEHGRKESTRTSDRRTFSSIVAAFNGGSIFCFFSLFLFFLLLSYRALDFIGHRLSDTLS